MGAYVKEPKPARYDWVVSFDATSLYPSIIMTWNMSPETLVDGQKFLADDERSIQRLIDREFITDTVKENDWAMAANGQTFRRDKKGIFPQLIEYYFAERQKAKKLMLFIKIFTKKQKIKRNLYIVNVYMHIHPKFFELVLIINIFL